MQNNEWWLGNMDNQFSFCQYAIEIELFKSPNDVLEFFQKPWKWDEEYFTFRRIQENETNK